MSDAGWYTFDGQPLPIDSGNVPRSADGQAGTQADRDAALSGVFSSEKSKIDRERFLERVSDEYSDETSDGIAAVRSESADAEFDPRFLTPDGPFAVQPFLEGGTDSGPF